MWSRSIYIYEPKLHNFLQAIVLGVKYQSISPNLNNSKHLMIQLLQKFISFLETWNSVHTSSFSKLGNILVPIIIKSKKHPKCVLIGEEVSRIPL